MPVLLSKYNANPKAAKNEKLGWGTTVLHLAPANLSGFQVCSHRSPGCEAACLHYAGNVLYQTRKEAARIRKTQLFFSDREVFMAQLVRDIQEHVRRMQRMNLRPAVRLNATSDIPWERVRFGADRKSIIETFPDLQFYDYTAIPNRVVPDNYHLTFSLKENNQEYAEAALRQGMNLAVVFFTSQLPDQFWNLPVVDGDEHDFRPADPTQCVVGLKAKGSAAKSDQSGFVNA